MVSEHVVRAEDAFAVEPDIGKRGKAIETKNAGLICAFGQTEGGAIPPIICIKVERVFVAPTTGTLERRRDSAGDLRFEGTADV